MVLEEVTHPLAVASSIILFRAGLHDYTVVDCLLLAQCYGRLQERVQQTHRALAARQQAARVNALPSPTEVTDAITDFRLTRKLKQAAALEHWLEERQLTYQDLVGHFERSLASERMDSVAVEPVPDLVQAVHVDAVADGDYETWAVQLSSYAGVYARFERSNIAVPAAAPERAAMFMASAEVLGRAPWSLPGLAQRAEHLAAIEASVTALPDTLRDPRILRAVVATRQLDWTRVSYEALHFQSGAAAQEALWCLRDGDAPEEVARESGGRFEQVADAPLQSVAKAMRQLLINAPTLEWQGPCSLDGAMMLFRTQKKELPVLDEHEHSEHAHAAALEQAMRDEAERVNWVLKI